MKRYWILGLLMSLALSVSARHYYKDEVVYVNTDQTYHDGDIIWDDEFANVFLYFFQSWDNSKSEWLKLEYIAPHLFRCVMTKEYDYDRVIVVRKTKDHSNAGWNDVWYQTCNLTIADGVELNYLHKFWKREGNNECTSYPEWKTYTPKLDAVVATINGVTEDRVDICPEALGGPFSLKAQLRPDGNDMNYYYDDVAAHTWLVSTNGKASWSCIDDFVGNVRSGETDRDIIVTLPTSGTDFYYYLYSNIPSGRRLIHVTTNNSLKCNLDCEITAFETAVSGVNADDNTYTLDGMVAFGEANGMKLVIECDGQSLVIDNPKSPQSFSLHGVPAATVNGKTTTAKAYFRKSTGARSCEKEITIGVPNVKEAIEERNIHSLTKTTIELKPTDCDPANDFVWIINGKEYKKGETGVSQEWTIPNAILTEDIMKDSSFTCVYKEFLPAPGDMEDLMRNGSYEASSGYDNISEYDYWGIFPQTSNTQLNFYTDTVPGGINPDKKINNGFAVVRNAYNFAPSFAKVTARHGNNFGLFDAVTGDEGGDKMAWFATTSQNEKLKLKKGTTYVLSFWAANINNYGEMDNAASFVFRILDNKNNKKIIGNSDTLNLADPKFRNNLWHQCSKTFLATKDYDDITIAVVNLNTKAKPGVGNDFALDDIQFHPISVVSKVVKSQQQFNVTVHEPKVTSFTAETLPLNCDEGPEYKVAVEVKYKNPNSALIIEDSNPNVGNKHEYTLPSIAFETEGTLKDTLTVSTNDHSYVWHTYFKDWTTAQAFVTTPRAGLPRIDTAKIAFSEPACEDLTTTLSFDLKYRFQQGKLQYWVDNLAKKEAEFNAKDTAERTLSLTFEGILADGKDNHVLHVSFNGAHSCIKEYKLPVVPLSPKIDKVEIISVVPKVVSCSTKEYTIDVRVTTHYEATGEQIVLYYDNAVGADNKELVSEPFVLNKDKGETTITVQNIENGQHSIEAAFANRPECRKPIEKPYDAPRVAQIGDFDVNVSALKCDENKYTISGSIAFDLLDGNVSDGDLIVEFDNEHRQVIPSPTSSPVNFSIAEMDKEGAQLYVTAWFSKSEEDVCKQVSNTFVSPGKPSMDTLNVRFSEPTCDVETVDLTFDLKYTYQQGQLTYQVDNLTPVTVDAEEYGDKNNEEQIKSFTFTGVPADGKAHQLRVEFGDNLGCKDSYDLPATPLSPMIDKVEITSVVPKVVSCSTTEYKIDVKVTTHYEATNEQLLLFYDNAVGADNQEVVSEPFVVNGKEGTTTITVQNIENGQHSIEAAFANRPECRKPIEKPYDAPRVAQISDFDVNVSALKCDEDKYTISGSIAFDLLDGNVSDGDLIVEFDDEHKQVIPAPTSSPVNFSIGEMDKEGTQLFVTAWFSKSEEDVCKKVSNTFDSPGKPSMDTLNVRFGEPTCDVETVDLTFDLKYTYQQGQLTYQVDNLTPVTVDAEEYGDKNNTEQIKSFTFTGVPADGKVHQLRVEFGDNLGCKDSYDLPAAPLSPKIESVTVSGVPATVICPTQEYQAIVTIATPYDVTGKNFVVTYNGQDYNVAATGSSTQTTLTLTDIDGAAGKVTAVFADALNCTPTESANDLMPPTRIPCIKDEDAICEGEDYTWERHNKTYPTPALGVDTFTVGYDSLFLTVHSKPEIRMLSAAMTCESEADVLLPFELRHGSPDVFTITINNKPYDGQLDDTGANIVFKREDLTAGEYTATVTVGEANSPCTTETTTTFTIAAANQMYSKWTNVLFVSNRDSIYTSYQWFADGELMAGEMLQRLYNPEGLPATYYCRMTTKDGKTIYTCPQTFDEVTPSRTQTTTPAAVRATRLYDTMGRSLNRAPNKGIYIIFEELENGETRARKIAIYE